MDAEGFDLVDDLASAVVAFAGISFGVLIGEDGGHGLAYGEAGDVFAGDEFEVIFLSALFLVDEVCDVGIDLVEGFSVGVDRRD